MSYTFDLFHPRDGADPTTAIGDEESAARPGDADELNPGPIDPAKEQQKEKLVEALTALHPTLQRFEPDYPAIAKSKKIDVDEARRRYRNIELNEDQYSLQIYLFDDAAGAAYAYSGPYDESRKALQILWDSFALLQREGGFATYDAQAGKVLDLDKDFDLVLKTICGPQPSTEQAAPA